MFLLFVVTSVEKSAIHPTNASRKSSAIWSPVVFWLRHLKDAQTFWLSQCKFYIFGFPVIKDGLKLMVITYFLFFLFKGVYDQSIHILPTPTQILVLPYRLDVENSTNSVVRRGLAYPWGCGFGGGCTLRLPWTLCQIWHLLRDRGDAQ